MNIDDMYCGSGDGASLRWLGIGLSDERTCIIRSSLIRLKKENRWTGTWLWGRLRGTTKDYWIACGWSTDCINGLVRYYSTDGGYTWVLLPWPPSDKICLLSMAASHLPFTGDPASAYDVPSEPGDPLELGPSRIKEEDRLAAVIREISDDSWCVPRAAICRTPDGCIKPNPAFQGLPPDESQDIRSWLHLRKSKNKPWNYNLLHRKDYNYAFDFLDVCDEDIPPGCWSVQQHGGDVTVVRSLTWPGASAFHRVGSTQFGWFYFGNGKKNLDIPHMMPNVYY